MINLSTLSIATLIVDGAAVFLLAGLIIYSRLYRGRGEPSDRLFFAMEVLTIIMAVSDGLTYILDSSTIPKAYAVSYFCNTVFYLAFETIAGFFALYLLMRLKTPKPVSMKAAIVLLLPAAAMNVMVIANLFTRFLFDVNPLTNEYVSFDLYDLIFIGPAVYGGIILILLLRIDWTVVWLFLVLVSLRLFLGRILRDVSSTALLFAMGLVFAHIHMMGKPFREGGEAE